MGFIDLTGLGPAEIAHGWIFIGLCINILLLGIMITQVYLYYTTYKHDKIWSKLFVAFLFVADVINTIFDTTYMYRTLIVQFGNTEALSKADWLFACDPAMTAIIALAVQLFFAWRVYVLTKTPVWAVIIVAVALAGGVCGLITAVDVVRIPVFTEFQKFKTVVVIWLACEAIGDVIITTILVWYLCRKHKTGFKRSDMIVDKIIRMTVQTGLITMIIATFDMVFYLSDPSGLHLMFNFPLCKLYSNSVMSSLNSRAGWQFSHGGSQGESQGQSTGNVTLKSRQLQVSGKAEILSYEHNPNPGVFVHVESHELRDRSDANFDEKMDPALQKSAWSAV